MQNKKIHIVADDKIPFLKGVFEPFAKMEYYPGKEISQRHLKNADALITRTRTKVTKELLEGTSVKFVATATIGFDHIDTTWLAKKGIRWSNAPGCNSSSVMQYIAATLVLLARKKGFSFRNKTIGVIGVGNVGSKVAHMAKALGFNVLLNDPPRERKEGKTQFTTLTELLSLSDIVSMHVPLNKTGTDKTLAMVNDDFFRILKKGATFINSSRGPIVEEISLKKAVASGKNSSTILDVWSNEPDIDPELVKHVDIATPHIAGYSVDGKANGTAMSVNVISDFFDFPLINWYPGNLPDPENPVIHIDNTHLSEQEVLETAIYHTYPIERDDKNLRTNLKDFEKLRGSYPVRREFSAYEIKLKSKNDRLFKKLIKLGFKK